MKNPEVSVLIPVYNADKYLGEAIDSILNQDFTDFELIVINDGSTDESEAIVNSYNDARIIYVKNSENIKLIDTLNKGLALCRGQFIARMDADDISYRSRLKEQVSFLRSNPKIGVLGSYYRKINETGGYLNGVVQLSESHEEIYCDFLFKSCPIVHPSVLIRKSVLKNLNPIFKKEFLHAEDMDLWCRLIHKTKFFNLSKTLIKYRIHQNQVTNQHNLINRENTLKIKKRFLKENFPSLKNHLIHNYCNITVYHNFHLSNIEIENFLHFVVFLKKKSTLYFLAENYFSILFFRFLIHPKEFNLGLIKLYRIGVKLGFKNDNSNFMSYKFFGKCILPKVN